MSLADLFQTKDLKRAFAHDDDDDDDDDDSNSNDNALENEGFSSSEARTWLATLHVTTDAVTEDPAASDDKRCICISLLWSQRHATCQSLAPRRQPWPMRSFCAS